MAKVIEQGVSPITNDLEVFVPEMETIQGKMLAELPHIFNGFLAKKQFFVAEDPYGNPYIDLGDTRVSLVIAIITENGICTYKRKGTELNFNDGIDAIGSVGYGIPSLFFKIPSEMWNQKIKSAKLAQNYAWEKTDGDGDKKWVKMPVIILEIQENVFCTIPKEKIQKPTAKMQVVLNELN